MFTNFLILLAVLSMAFFVWKRFDIHASLGPLFVISASVLIMLAFGLVGKLNYGVYALAVIAFVSLAWAIVVLVRDPKSLRGFASAGLFAFVILSCFFIFLLKDVSLIHYDNFSHWATVLKEMLYFNSLPDDRSIVTFRAYPPGSALWDYIACFLSGGFDESNALVAQSMIISASLATLFLKAKGKWGIVVAACVSIVSLVITTTDIGHLFIYDLLIDLLLGVVAGAAVIIALTYWDNLKMLVLLMVPVLSFLILIKDNAIAVLGIVLLLVLVCWIKESHGRGRKWIKSLLCLVALGGAPALVSMLWRYYVVFAYPLVGYGANKYAVSPNGILSSFFSHDPSFLLSLPFDIVLSVFDFSKPSSIVFVSVNVALIIMIVAQRFFNNGNYLHSFRPIGTFFTANAVVAVYCVGLYVLYAAMMPLNEVYSDSTQRLAAFDRYFLPAIIMFIFVVTNSLLRALSAEKATTNAELVWSALLLAAFAVPVCFRVPMLIEPPRVEESSRWPAKVACEEARKIIPREAAIAFYYGDEKNDYNYHLSAYEMSTNDRIVLTSADLTDKEVLKEKLEGYDWLVVAAGEKEFWQQVEQLGYVTDSENATCYSIQRAANSVSFEAR